MDTSTVQDRRAPGAGTKVDEGQDAPVRREGAGHVEPGSLAAESYQQDGQFAQNRNAEPDSRPSANTRSSKQASSGQISSDYTSSEQTSSSSSGGPRDYERSDVSGGADSSIPSQGGAAPTYVLNQYNKDTKGPHGKNITEDDSLTGGADGLQKAFNAKVGSKNDPGRLAERQFDLQDSATSANDAGARQTELVKDNVYGDLKDSSA